MILITCLLEVKRTKEIEHRMHQSLPQFKFEVKPFELNDLRKQRMRNRFIDKYSVCSIHKF